MSFEGLWAAEFGHAGANFAAANAGIAVLETGRVFGGDSWFAYTGTFEPNGKGVTGRLRVKRHKNDPLSIDAFNTGDNEFEVVFNVIWRPDGSALEGIIEREATTLGLRLRKLAELP